ncbi:MAG: M20 family metallopeptidase [Solibacillus sp.]
MQAKDYFAQHEKDILEDIKRLVLADSPSQNKELLDQCKNVIQNMFHENFKRRAQEFVMTHNGNHLRFEVGEGKEQVLIMGHYDTVWDEGVLPYRVEPDKIYGPGILDMKSGLISALWLLKYVQKFNKPLKRRIVFLINSDEEIGSPTSRKLIEEEAAKSVAAFVLEPAVVGSGALKTGRKGTSKYLLTFHGIAAHAGNNPLDGASAIVEAAEQILAVEQLNDYDKGTTLNVGLMEGGGKLNVIPNRAHLGIEVRSKTSMEQNRIHDYFVQLQPKNPRIQMTMEGGINRPPMEQDEDNLELFEVAKGVAAELGFSIGDALVGGASDGNFASQFAPTLDGLGLVGEGLHAMHEHIERKYIVDRFALLTNTVLKVVNQ